VYVRREPKDVFVSWWHFENKVYVDGKMGLEDAFDMFCQVVRTFLEPLPREHLASPDMTGPGSFHQVRGHDA
jgi:hypothetical protein